MRGRIGRGGGEARLGVQVDPGGRGGRHQLGAHRGRQRCAVGGERGGDELERVPVLADGDKLAGVGEQIVVDAARETQEELVRRVVHSGLLVRVRTRPRPTGGNARAQPTR